MLTYTLADAEADYRAALLDGDPARIAATGATLDKLDTPKALPTLHAAALWYAEQGVAIFRLTPGSKVPLPGSRGCKDATTDLERVHAWWSEVPDANIGLATGHLLDVVDIDGTEGHAAIGARWGETWGGLDVVGTVSTPRAGGMHLYVPASGRGNKAGLLHHVDYRGAGGYVVAPPSRTDAGAYEWVRPVDLAALSMVGAA